jgi:dTDP-4-amino-4,6-dideoxygalactose transaminase
MTAPSYDRQKGHAFAYDVRGLGWNFRSTEIASALGLVQLSKLDRNNARRRGLVERYRDRLRAIEGVDVPFRDRDLEDSSCHICPALLPDGADRTRVQKTLREAGIQTSMHYPPIHLFGEFRDRYHAEVPRTERAARRLITLPLHPLMSEADVDLVVDNLRGAVAVEPEPGTSRN